MLYALIQSLVITKRVYSVPRKLSRSARVMERDWIGTRLVYMQSIKRVDQYFSDEDIDNLVMTTVLTIKA